MTKKKTTKSRSGGRKKKKNTGSSAGFFYTVKKIFIWAFFAIILFIALLFLADFIQNYNKGEKGGKFQPADPGIELPVPSPEPEPASPPAANSNPSSRKVPEKPSTSTTPARKSSKEKDSVTHPVHVTFVMPEKAEVPKLVREKTEQVISHEGYTVSYNSDYRIANWVAYELTEEKATTKNAERSKKFVPDPHVVGYTAVHNDYTNSGYDRGHMAPAADMRWSEQAMSESFYLSNVCPQHPKLNRGIWKKLEEQVRKWAEKHGSILVITGPVIGAELERIGKNEVGVPEIFYKVLCMQIESRPVAIGFLFENKNYAKTDLKSLVITVDSVQKVTGIDFFPLFPEPLQSRMESSVEWECWQF